MYCFFVIYIAVSISGIATDGIQSKIKAYFDSDTTQSLLNQWRTIQPSYEATIEEALQQNYGQKSLSVYINRFRSPLTITAGYYHTDNQVELIFQHMGLEELPSIYDAAITLPLSSNVLSFEASISSMIVHTSYILFRNKSDIIFAVEDQDSRQGSPFRFQQVRNVGQLAITLGGCTLSGIAIATLSGQSVNLGHYQMRLSECQHTIEIYSQGSGAPPVVAPYLMKGENGLNIEYLLLHPLLDELLPKLQGALFSYVNTSSIFKELSKFQVKQESIFDETKAYLDRVVTTINSQAIENNMGTINLDDFTIVWDDPLPELPKATAVKLFGMVLMGLDTVYSAHTGGPFKLTETEIGEQLRFETLEVTGSISVIGFQADSEFAVEITDLAVDSTFDSSNKGTFEVVGWRYLEFSCPKMEFLPVESFVVGYLLNEVPKHIVSHLSSIYSDHESQLTHPLDEEPYEEEGANDGKDIVPTDAILDHDGGENLEFNLEVDGDDDETQAGDGQQQLAEPDEPQTVKLNEVVVVPEEEEAGGPLKLNLNPDEPDQVQLYNVDVAPHKEDEGEVKLHNVDAVPHVEDEGQVKLLNVEVAPHIEEEGEVKLHNVEAEPHVEEEEPVKLHNVEVSPHVEEEGQIKLNLENAAPEVEDHGQVKLNNVDVAPHVEEPGIVKLLNVEVAPHEEEKGPVKLLNVEVAPHEEENGPVKLLNVEVAPHIEEEGPVKLHNVEAAPHEEENGPVKLHNVEVVPHVEAPPGIKRKAAKKFLRVKKNQTRSKKPTRTSSKTIKPLRLAKNGSKPVASTTPKIIHIKDNEIRSN